jgi:hypothetical protein
MSSPAASLRRPGPGFDSRRIPDAASASSPSVRPDRGVRRGLPSGAVQQQLLDADRNRRRHQSFGAIDATYVEIILQASSGTAPFIQALDALGASTFGPVPGLPPFALYAVSLALGSFGQIVEVSPPTNFTIL